MYMLYTHYNIYICIYIYTYIYIYIIHTVDVLFRLPELQTQSLGEW